MQASTNTVLTELDINDQDNLIILDDRRCNIERNDSTIFILRKKNTLKEFVENNNSYDRLMHA